MSDLLQVERREQTAVVFLDRPPTNALCEALLEDLYSALTGVLSDEAVRAVVLASRVRYAFCSGLDLQEIYDPNDAVKSAANTVRATEASARIARLLAGGDKPVIAAINGIVVGSGVTLALACDFRVCSDVSQFRLPDVQYGGLLGDGGIQLLRRIAGVQVAKELLLLGEKVRADRAQAMGLVNKLVPQGTELEEALKLARTLSRRAPRSIAYCKRVLDAPESEEERVASALLLDIVQSSDTFEGLCAFAEHRQPKFEGK